MCEWCMLDVRLAQEPAPCLCSLCFCCPASLENFQSPGTPSTYPEYYHRLKGWTIGCRVWPPAAIEIIGTKSVPVGTEECRSALNSCRRQFWQQQTATEHGMEFWDKCMHGHTPYHAMDSREHGPRPPGHQSRISMHDGPRSQSVQLQCGMKCT